MAHRSTPHALNLPRHRRGHESRSRADGRDLIVSTIRRFVAYDLNNLVDPGLLGTSELANFAELASGGRLVRGEVTALSADEWRERWSLFRQAHPFVSSP